MSDNVVQCAESYAFRCDTCLEEANKCGCSYKTFTYMSPKDFKNKKVELEKNKILDCIHEYTTYEGIFNKFDYCVKCDKKIKGDQNV